MENGENGDVSQHVQRLVEQGHKKGNENVMILFHVMAGKTVSDQTMNQSYAISISAPVVVLI